MYYTVNKKPTNPNKGKTNDNFDYLKVQYNKEDIRQKMIKWNIE